MTIKIISDGTRRGTKVVNAETGEELKYITAIDWHSDVQSGFAMVDIKFVKVPVELVGAAAVATREKIEKQIEELGVNK